MKKVFTITILIVLVFTIIGCTKSSEDIVLEKNTLQIINKNMKFTSSAFENNALIPSKYTCGGENVNPPLNIQEIPQGTQSLALIIDDPDAPAGDWVHWLVWNISPDVNMIEENSVPNGARQGTTDFGSTKYSGPCPPSGTHRYQFKLYALDIILDIDSSTRKKDLENAMSNHILDQAILIANYSH